MKYEIDEQVANFKNTAIVSDYHLLDIPNYDPDQYPVLVALSQKEPILTRLEISQTAFKKKPLDVDLNLFAAFNVFRQSPQCRDEEISILLDLGAEETQLTIQHGQQLLYARTLSGGGAGQTQAIADALQVMSTRGELIKIERAQVFSPETESGSARVQFVPPPPALVAAPPPPPPAAPESEYALVPLEDEIAAPPVAAPEAEVDLSFSDAEVGADADLDFSQVDNAEAAPPAARAAEKSYETAPLNPAEAERVSRALQKEIAALVQNVQSSVAFFVREFKLDNATRPSKIYFTGGGSLVPGFMDELGRRVRMEVARFDLSAAFTHYAKPAVKTIFAAPEGGIYAVAAGLAWSRASGATQTSTTVGGIIKLSLLPPEIKLERQFWQEKIFVYYAAATAVLVAGLILYSSWKFSAAAAERNRVWQAALTQAKSEHESLTKAIEENERAATMLQDLRLQENSGAIITQALLALRQQTPESVFLVGLNFGPNATATPAAASSLRSRSPAAGDATATADFVTAPFLRLNGYLVGQKTENEARQKLEAYVKALSELPELHNLKLVVIELVQDRTAPRETAPNGKKPPEIPAPQLNEKTAFDANYQPLLTDDSDGNLRLPNPPGGSALYFVIEGEVATERVLSFGTPQ
jgi:Tfp pilus assembly PilM family ATPase